MIHFCDCAGGSASKLELPVHHRVRKNCKICGGSLLVDGQGSLSESMFSTVGLENVKVIDPQLNWKMAIKGKPRAVRRARTSFTGSIIKKSSEKGSKEIEDRVYKASKGVEEMPPVSESEKLGITILGQRFSDTPIESIPIKKRKFLLVRSPSPPPCSPSLLDKPEQVLASHSASANLTKRQQLLENNNAVRTVLDEEKNVGDEKTNLEDMDGTLCDSADFSGISILASAACNSRVGDVVMNADSSVSKGHSFTRGLLGISENMEFRSLPENKCIEEQVINAAEISDSKTNIPLVSSSALMSLSGGQDEKKTEGCDISKYSSLLPNLPNKANGNLGRRELSFCNDRYHWDLNTVMDAWERSYDVVVSSELPDTITSVEDGFLDGKLYKKELCEGKIEPDDTKSAAELLEISGRLSIDSCGSMSAIKKKTEFSGRCLVADHDASAAQDGQQLNGTLFCLPGHYKKPKSSNYVGPSGFNADAVCSPVRHTPDLAEGSCSANGCAFDGEKADIFSSGISSMIEAKTTPFYMILGRNANIEHPVHGCEPPRAVDEMASEIVSEDKTFGGFKADLGKPSVVCCMADFQMCEVIHVDQQPEKNLPIRADPQTSKTNDSCIGSIPEQDSGMLIDENICKKMIAGGEMRVDSVRTEPLVEGRPNVVSLSKESDKSICPSEPLAPTLQGLPNCEQIAGGSMSNVERETAEVEFQNIKGLSVQNVSGTEIGCRNHTDLKDLVTPSVVDYPLMDALSSHGTHKSYTGDLVNGHVDNALDYHFNCDYDSDASENYVEQAVGMGKVVLQGDDDSQYEDGEFRGWGLDGSVEGETEPVDYGSDDRDMDAFEAASDYPTSTISFNADSGEHKEEEPLEDSHVHPGGNHVGKKHVQEPVPTSVPQESAVTNVFETGSSRSGTDRVAKKVPRGGHSRKKDLSKKLEGSMKDASKFCAVAEKVVADRELLSKGDGARHLSDSASLRMKPSGWDQLPDDCRSYGDAVVVDGFDRDERNHADVSSEAPSNESLRRVGRSMLRRDLSSRIERCKSSDVPERKHQSYPRGSSGEKDAGSGRSIGRCGSSLHMHGRRRGGGRLVDSSSYPAQSRPDSPGYYGPAGSTHPARKDASAVSTAKVESKGFVVAPDGTVVEGGAVGPAFGLSRRSTNASSESKSHTFTRRGSCAEREAALTFGLGPAREMSPDRRIVHCGSPRKCRPRMVHTRCREVHRGSMLDDGVESSLPMHHPISRSERSFSPRRRTLCVSQSHTRSLSQSRTHPPHVSTSPRRSDNGINGRVQRRSRSPPNFRSAARVERMRSPHWRSGFPEPMVSFASRNHASPPHASRWNGERKDLPEHFGEEYKRRPSRRSPPVILYPRSQRFDPMDSPGRLKPDEHYKPMQSRRLQGFRGDRGHRIGDSDDDRRHGDRYEMLPSLRQCGTVNDVKGF